MYRLQHRCTSHPSLAAAKIVAAAPRWQFSRAVLCRNSRSSKSSRVAVEDVLSELQRLSPAKQGQQKQLELSRLLAKASSRLASMSVRQLCRLAFILACHQDSSAANIKPIWQAVLRRLLHSTGPVKHTQQQQRDSSTGRHTSTTTSSDAVSTSSSTSSRPQPPSPHPQLQALLQSQAAAGEVLYLLRALAAWRDQGADGLQAFGSSSSTDQATGRANIVAAVVAAASHQASTMTLRDLLLSATALAQLTYYDRHIFTTASRAFVQAVAAAAANSSATAETASSSSRRQPHQGPLQQRQQQRGDRQQQLQELLPHIRDHQLVINYLWANASIGHADTLLLQAALQLLLSRGLVSSISRSHLPLCMWALTALLVCQLDQQQKQCCEQGQQQQQLVQAVDAVHSMLAAQAGRLWQEAGSCQQQQQQGSHKGLQSTRAAVFSMDSRRQMFQSHVWLTAAAAAAAAVRGSSTAPGLEPTAAAAVTEVSTLWSTAQLLAVAQQQPQQQPQQQQQQQQQQQSDFWCYCGEAWSGQTTQVSALQLEVHQALQTAGLQATLELPAAQLPLQRKPSAQQQLEGLIAAQLPLKKPSAQQQLQKLAAAAQPQSQDLTAEAQQQSQDSTAAAQEHGALAVAGSAGLLSVDMACVMPAWLLQSAQQQGLRAVLSELQQRNASHTGTAGLTAGSSSNSTTTTTTTTGSSSTTNSSTSCSPDSSGGSCDSTADVLVAVEVDGPTHVSAGCASHQLGATVCRNWLLVQWGWSLLVVPWWEWQDGQQQQQQQPLPHSEAAG